MIAGLEGARPARSAQEARAARGHDRRDRRGAERRPRGGRRRREALRCEPADERRRRRAAAGRAAPAVGDRVIVGGLGLEGVVTGVHDGIGRSRRARQADARQRRATCASSAPRRRGGRRASTCTSSCSRATTTPSRSERDRLHAWTRRSSRAERFLDESLLTDQRTVRLIHGYGTGQLKRALAGFLQQHPLVARFATAPPEQGGGGVTVVELKD